MTSAQLVSVLFDLGFGLAALRLAGKLVTRQNATEEVVKDHGRRIVVLEIKAA